MKKKSTRGRPKLKPGDRGTIQLTLYKYFRKGIKNDFNNKK